MSNKDIRKQMTMEQTKEYTAREMQGAKRVVHRAGH